MDASEIYTIIQFTPHQTTILPKWIFYQKLFFKPSSLLNCWCGMWQPSLLSDSSSMNMFHCKLFPWCYLKVCGILLVGWHDTIVEVGSTTTSQHQVRQTQGYLTTGYWYSVVEVGGTTTSQHQVRQAQGYQTTGYWYRVVKVGSTTTSQHQVRQAQGYLTTGYWYSVVEVGGFHNQSASG